MWTFGRHSEKNLIGIAPPLVMVAREGLMLSPVDFGIVQGVRTLAQQTALYAQGRQVIVEVNRLRKIAGMIPLLDRENKKVTWKMDSDHLPRADGFGYAFDFGVYVNGVYQNGDTEDEKRLYFPVAKALKLAAARLEIEIDCGIDWKASSDLGHISLKGA